MTFDLCAFSVWTFGHLLISCVNAVGLAGWRDGWVEGLNGCMGGWVDGAGWID